MGNGASMDFASMRMSPVDRASAFLFKKEQVESLGLLAQSFEERISFANFIKEGSWLDDISMNRNFKTTVRSRRGSLVKPAGVVEVVNESLPEILYDYIVPIKQYASMKESLVKLLSEDEEEEHDSGKTSLGMDPSQKTDDGGGSRRTSIDSTKTVNLHSGPVGMIWSPSKRALEEQEVHNVLQGDYFDLEQSASDTGFSKYQLLSVLFLVLHPLYVRSKIRTEGSMKRTSRFCFMDSYGQCRCAVPCAEPLVSSPEACKAEELLLAAAAFFDEDRMLRVLSVSSWAKQVPIALEGCSLGVAVSEARNDGEFRFVYANTMMQKITGYSMRSLAGKTFKLLEGPETEPEQAQRMAVAIRKQRMLKIGITHHRRNGSAFTNMLVLNPVFDEDGHMLYLLSVSFDLSRREATAQELQQVDVLLSLLPLLLTCQYDAPARTTQAALAL